MAKIELVTVDPDDPKAIAEAITHILQVLDGGIEFGDPIDPKDTSLTGLAGATATPPVDRHNGSLQNMGGSWVEVSTIVLDTAIAFNHNLGVPIDAGTRNLDEPNVRWLFTNFSHDGTGADANSCLTLHHEEGDSITTDTIELRLYSSSGRTVGSSNPVKISAYFIPVVRWLPTI